MAMTETIDYGIFIQQDQFNQPEQNESETMKTVLQKYIPPKNTESKKISRIVTQFYYIHQNEKIEDLTEDIKRDNSIRAIGVTDDTDQPIGFININELLQLLSRPYGRDVLKNHPVSEVMQPIRLFSRDRNILSVSEEIYKEGNVPLGVSQQITPKHNKITLKPGEILLLLTDGFFDQMNTKNNKYTIKRIAGIINKNKNKSYNEIKSILLDDFHKFRGTQPQIDDITFILLKYDNENSSTL
ncbi:MAG: SpoIIE family protein phosphatase [Spirochaetales bacterium]|nr:SpoIIE family protein phosphatase [Spirochaetales bacterium]